MNEEQIEKLLELGIEFKNKELYQDSINILERVIVDYPNYNKTIGIMLLLAGNYFEIEEYSKSIQYAFKVLHKKPDNELANLLLYMAYFNIDEHEKSFMVLFTYLDKYEAKLFKDTLEELLDGLIDGYGKNHKDNIIFYSKKNNIDIPKELID